MNPLLLKALEVALLGLLKQHFGLEIPAGIVAKLMIRLPDAISLGQDLLLDGDGHLSAANLNVLNSLVLDARNGRL